MSTSYNSTNWVPEVNAMFLAELSYVDNISWKGLFDNKFGLLNKTDNTAQLQDQNSNSTNIK